MRSTDPGRRRSGSPTAPRIRVPTVDRQVEPHRRVMARARQRVWLLAGLFGVALTAIGGRAVQLCVAPDPEVIDRGGKQRWEQMTLQARRGSIFDRHGHRLVTSVATPNVVVDPARVDEVEAPGLARRVARMLGQPVEAVAAKMQGERRYARLATRVHPALASEVVELDDEALWVESAQRRYYAEGSLAAHVLGFVDGQGHGRAGVEHALDDDLRGSSVLLQRRRDRKGLDVDRLREVDRGTSAGMDVHLTLDRQIQHITEQALAGVMERHDPVAAMAVVVDVGTGDILALANAPTYNPNALTPDPAPQRNRVVMDAVEPGSVFKPFVAAAAIEEGLVSLDTPVDCENGAWRVPGATIHDDHPKGVIPVRDVIKYSSNIGSVKLAFDLTAPVYLDYLRRFGFGDRLGVELPGERTGFIRPAETIRPVELATTAFGQGTTATVLQLAYATAAIANDGVRMRPRLVTRIIDEDGVPARVTEPEVAGRVVSASTARAVTEAMVSVTEAGGTATRAAIPGYRVAGKTGTAQKPENGGYGAGRIGSFIGFLPADAPELAIVVLVDEPRKGSRYGGIVAAPAFAEIGERALRHLGVPPDPALLEPEPEVSAAPSAEPLAAAPAASFDQGAWVLPDLTGHTVREALSALEGTGLALSVQGSGRLARMEPPPGARLPAGDRVHLTFQ
jgi:cell division protein FtsI (penicillin-binding protein 3)